MTIGTTPESNDPEEDRLVNKYRRASDVWGFFGRIDTPEARRAYNELCSYRWENVTE